MASGHVVTALFTDWSRGDRGALGQLLPLVCEELRRIAARQLGWERVGYPAAGARVHEAYPRFVDEHHRLAYWPRDDGRGPRP
jgi:ECF sigma factor